MCHEAEISNSRLGAISEEWRKSKMVLLLGDDGVRRRDAERRAGSGLMRSYLFIIVGQGTGGTGRYTVHVPDLLSLHLS